MPILGGAFSFQIFDLNTSRYREKILIFCKASLAKQGVLAHEEPESFGLDRRTSRSSYDDPCRWLGFGSVVSFGRETTMAKIVCVLYDDPVDGYPKSYARDGLPTDRPLSRRPDAALTQGDRLSAWNVAGKRFG